MVCADLRGYGDSSKPAGLPDHSNYDKRVMAQDMVELMASLGFERFHLVGHDRGGRVAHRLAADHPQRVQTVAVLDISPTLKMFERTDMAFALAYYHWFLMLQPPPLPGQMLAGQVPFNILGRIGREEPDLSKFSEEAVREYVRCFADLAAIHASCEDYRAAGTIDLEHDRADRVAGRKLPMVASRAARPTGCVACSRRLQHRNLSTQSRSRNASHPTLLQRSSVRAGLPQMAPAWVVTIRRSIPACTDPCPRFAHTLTNVPA